MSVKINALELENVKRIKAVKIDPTQNGLTIIGGTITKVRLRYLTVSHGL